VSAGARDLLRAVAASRPKALARQVARLPLVHEATQLLESLPLVELVDLAGAASFNAKLAPVESRHAWSLGAAEQLVLQALVHGRDVKAAFEIGTFNGGTTRVLAEALPADGRIVTLDLPADAFDQTQAPQAFRGICVGRAYRESSAAHKVKQLLEDSTTFDPAPYVGQFDLVLVDGGHEYQHGLTDSRTALQLVSPGGIVLWDDFQPYWHGLVRGVCAAMSGREIGRLAGTSFGVYAAPA
jgi:predicted O-methyltransferase YrrM